MMSSEAGSKRGVAVDDIYFSSNNSRSRQNQADQRKAPGSSSSGRNSSRDSLFNENDNQEEEVKGAAALIDVDVQMPSEAQMMDLIVKKSSSLFSFGKVEVFAKFDAESDTSIERKIAAMIPKAFVTQATDCQDAMQADVQQPSLASLGNPVEELSQPVVQVSPPSCSKGVLPYNLDSSQTATESHLQDKASGRRQDNHEDSDRSTPTRASHERKRMRPPPSSCMLLVQMADKYERSSLSQLQSARPGLDQRKRQQLLPSEIGMKSPRSPPPKVEPTEKLRRAHTNRSPSKTVPPIDHLLQRPTQLTSHKAHMNSSSARSSNTSRRERRQDNSVSSDVSYTRRAGGVTAGQQSNKGCKEKTPGVKTAGRLQQLEEENLGLKAQLSCANDRILELEHSLSQVIGLEAFKLSISRLDLKIKDLEEQLLKADQNLRISKLILKQAVDVKLQYQEIIQRCLGETTMAPTVLRHIDVVTLKHKAANERTVDEIAQLAATKPVATESQHAHNKKPRSTPTPSVRRRDCRLSLDTAVAQDSSPKAMDKDELHQKRPDSEDLGDMDEVIKTIASLPEPQSKKKLPYSRSKEHSKSSLSMISTMSKVSEVSSEQNEATPTNKQ